MPQKENPALEAGFSLCGPLSHLLPLSQTLPASLAQNTHSQDCPSTQLPTQHPTHKKKRQQARSQDCEIDVDKYWMREALKEAVNSLGVSSPNPAIGCVFLDSQGREVTRGFTQAYRGLHAERFAINQMINSSQHSTYSKHSRHSTHASQSTRSKYSRLKGGTAYVTLEPCSHVGHQLPCVDLLIESKIRRVIISRGDPNPLVNGEGIQKLRKAGIEVSIGLYAAESTALNFPFFIQQKLKRPTIALKWAQTLDGQLADDSNRSQWISRTTNYSHWLRQRYDAILIGAKTLLHDHPSLTVRDCTPPCLVHPFPIVLDPRGLVLRIDEHQQNQLLKSTFLGKRPSLYITHEDVLKTSKAPWINNIENISILQLQGPPDSPDSERGWISQIMAFTSEHSGEFSKLLGRPFQSLMVEGGPKTLSLFLKNNSADLLHVFIAPKITAGKMNRVSLLRNLEDSQPYSILSNIRLGSDLLIEMASQEVIEQTRPD